jgi:hypothetical protein
MWNDNGLIGCTATSGEGNVELFEGEALSSSTAIFNEF